MSEERETSDLIRRDPDHIHDHDKINVTRSDSLLGDASPQLKLDDDMTKERRSLPIYEFREHIVKAVTKYQCVVLVGETGSGKTTQIAQYLVDLAPELFLADGKSVVITQPRRVGAVSVARRVAQERGCAVGGDEVGFVVRFTNVTTANTKIRFMTDGVLLRELLRDPLLSRYSIAVLDEAHERSVNTDVLFGLLREMLKKRPDFRILITSATLDVEKFSTFFNSCPVLNIPGRMFPVEVIYRPSSAGSVKHRSVQALLPTNSAYLKNAVECVMNIHMEQGPGDILVFLTGQDEIEECVAEIQHRIQQLYDDEPELFDSLLNVLVLPLYGALPPDKQIAVFKKAPANTRKIVVATNIAETSLTINGIVYVVDPGFHKEKHYNARTGMESLDIVTISQVAAEQRKGRAGRTQPGKCYRLYAEEQVPLMSHVSEPEIRRVNLGTVVLYLKAIGIHDVIAFPFIDQPERSAMVDALKSLYFLGALDCDGNLTDLGRSMSDFPLDPPLARVLLAAAQYRCGALVATMTALLSVDNLLYRGANREEMEEYESNRVDLLHDAEDSYGVGDHALLLELFDQWQARVQQRSSGGASGSDVRLWLKDIGANERALREAENIRRQLVDIMNEKGIDAREHQRENIMRALCSGYFTKTAKRFGERVFLLQNRAQHRLVLHPSSSLADREHELAWVLFHTLVWTTKPFMRIISPIHWDWIQELYERMENCNVEKLTGYPVEVMGGTIAPGNAGEMVHGPLKAVEKRNDENAVSDAKTRYLERKRKREEKSRKKK